MDKIERYGIREKEIKKINLEEICIQFTPNSEMINHFFQTNGKMDTRMIHSPHYKIAHLYFENGRDWLEKNYESTDYYKMCIEFLGKDDAPIKKIISLCESIKKGYLRSGYEKEYPTILEKPFAFTRYNREVPMVKYEVFAGHHRVGVMLAIGIKFAKVIIGEDTNPLSCYSEGKIHNLCVLK